jgi:hypothetical protein
MICGIYGQVDVIFFSNTPCQFPFRFIVIINNSLELLFWFCLPVILLHLCTLGTNCCAVMWVCQGAENIAVFLHKWQLLCLERNQACRCYFFPSSCVAVPLLQLMECAWLHWCEVIQLLTSFGWLTLHSFQTNACVLRMLHLLCVATTWLAVLWPANEQSMSQQLDKWLPVCCWSVHVM